MAARTGAWEREIALAGPSGESVDLWRTIRSNGTAELAPNRVDVAARALELTLRAGRGRPRTVRLEAGRRGHLRVLAVGAAPAASQEEPLLDVVRRVLRLGDDLAPFYAVARADETLAWAAQGAGRLVSCPTVFEEVVKTICTTNCAWSATVRMVAALVDGLGEPSAGRGEPARRAFPTPEAMAQAPPAFYRERVRAGYRGAFLHAIARGEADGALRLEELASPELDDEEVERRLLALPGVGPYAAAHVGLALGRYRRLVLDSSTRPRYARLVGARRVADRTIERRFARYGPWAGLAFWLLLTRHWAE